MSDSEREDPATDLSKRDRLVNAWLAAGQDANVETVASLTDASESYASQVRQDMEDEGMSDDEIAEVTASELVEQYRRQLAAAGEGEPDAGLQEGEPDADRQEVAPSGTDGGGDEQTQRRVEQATPGAGQPQQSDRPPGQADQPRPQTGQPPGGAPQAGQGNQEGHGGQGGQGLQGAAAPPQGAPRAPQRHPPRPPQQGRQQPGASRQQRQSAEQSPQGEEGLYVPVGELRAVDATLAVLEEEASYEVQNVSPQHSQHQVALAKLYVAQKARELLGSAADRAVPAEEV